MLTILRNPVEHLFQLHLCLVTYCFTGYLNYMLKARDVKVNNLTASSRIEMVKNDAGVDVVERLDIDVFVDVPEDKRDVLERCCDLLRMVVSSHRALKGVYV